MSEEQKKLLGQQLWNVANTLRGKMNDDEFRDYILGFVFYKFLSEKMHLQEPLARHEQKENATFCTELNIETPLEYDKLKMEKEFKTYNADDIVIYNTDDGNTSVALMAKDGNVWMNQNQLAELFDTSKQNISLHIINVLEDKELDENSVVKNYLTTAADGKKYNVIFYALQMVLAIGFRVRSRRGTQFR